VGQAKIVKKTGINEAPENQAAQKYTFCRPMLSKKLNCFSSQFIRAKNEISQ